MQWHQRGGWPASGAGGGCTSPPEADRSTRVTGVQVHHPAGQCLRTLSKRVGRLGVRGVELARGAGVGRHGDARVGDGTAGPDGRDHVRELEARPSGLVLGESAADLGAGDVGAGGRGRGLARGRVASTVGDMGWFVVLVYGGGAGLITWAVCLAGIAASSYAGRVGRFLLGWPFWSIPPLLLAVAWWFASRRLGMTSTYAFWIAFGGTGAWVLSALWVGVYGSVRWKQLMRGCVALRRR